MLVVAHAGDQLAARVYLGLLERLGKPAAQIVAAGELLHARDVSLVLSDTTTRGCLRLTTGAVIELDQTRVVFNRLQHIEPSALPFGPRDAAYAAMEWHAFWLAWLAALPGRVINPATARGLSGPVLGEAEWLRRAALAGLPVRSWTLYSNPRAFRAAATAPARHPAAMIESAMRSREPRIDHEAVTGGIQWSAVAGPRVVGAFAERYGAAMQALARSTGCELIDIEWQRCADWCVGGVSSMPGRASPELAGALVELLAA